MLPALYLLLTLALAGALLALLRKPGAARGLAVWGMAALLPLLAALSAALWGQARAARVLATYTPRPVTVTVIHLANTQTVTLDARDAACVERALRLGIRSSLRTPGGELPLTPQTRITGELPPQAVVEALGISGGLSCPNLRALPEPTKSATPTR